MDSYRKIKILFTWSKLTSIDDDQLHFLWKLVTEKQKRKQERNKQKYQTGNFSVLSSSYDSH